MSGCTPTLSITPGWENVREAIGGREFIVQGGVADVSPRTAVADELHPRTALGITAAGSLVMATVDGRQSGYSTGVDLDELAELMLSRGVVEAPEPGRRAARRPWPCASPATRRCRW